MADTTTSPGQLSARANVALLTLQLRAAQQEAETAEAALADAGVVDVEGSLAQLRARLEPLVAQRRQALAAALADERAAAAGAVAEAQRAAAAILAEAHAEAQRRIVEAEAAEVLETSPEQEPEADVDDVAADVAEVAEVVDVAEAVDDHEVELVQALDVELDDLAADAEELPAPALVFWPALLFEDTEPEPVASEPTPTTFAEFSGTQSSTAPWAAPSPPPSGPPMVTLDAEAFAHMLGTVIAAVLEERSARTLPPQPYPTQAYPAQGYPMAVPMVIQTPASSPQQGFWSSAKHVDVLLMLIAMVIVLVVLAAWLA